MSALLQPALTPPPPRHRGGWTALASDLALAFDNLRAQKTRTLLTALGIIFGVGAVIGMLAIASGAKRESLALIEQLGVRNLMIESRPAASQQALQQRRRISHGLDESDLRVLQANVSGIAWISPRRVVTLTSVLPRPAHQKPQLYGVWPSFAAIHHFQIKQGRFFDALDDASGAGVCVLGEDAKVNLLGYGPGVGRYIKLDDVWLRVVGVLGPLAGSGGQAAPGAPAEDWNNIVYAPLKTVRQRFWNSELELHDPLDGVDISLAKGVDSIATSKVVSAILNATHHRAGDFRVIVPADLLAQQQRTQRIFTLVMVAIAAISLIVGGIGIMNIVLATVMERTHEIGVRRATGARRADITRQFLAESVLISAAGGIIGIGFGYLLAWLIARGAHWSTIVTPASVLIAFAVSVAVGVVFGIYPARKAARIDPIEALRYD